jgi:hypothetical protein
VVFACHSGIDVCYAKYIGAPDFLKTLAWREHLGNFSWRGVKIQFVLFGVTSDLKNCTSGR